LSLNEFEVIKRFFDHRGRNAPGVVLGIGDDAAIVRAEPGKDIVVAADVLNAGIHFPESTDARAIGHKALAVNLSDLAAMGARPSWFTLSLSMPEVDENWLTGFSAGMFELADQFEISLVGGDTVRGPLSISIQVMGQVASGGGLRRSGARAGDKVYVSGTLGDAALALEQIQHGEQPEPELRARLDYPVPRVDLGNRLTGIANSCIDISDGLLADLGHILDASKSGAILRTAALPVSKFLNGLDPDLAIRFALTGGDDFELCFTAPANESNTVKQLGREMSLPITCIGEITSQPGLQLSDYNKSLGDTGYNHFARDK